MVIKHALSILLSKFDLVYKVLLYFFVISLIIIAITVGILSTNINPLLDQIKDTGFYESFKEGIVRLFSGDSDFIESFKNSAASFDAVKDLLAASGKTFSSVYIVIGIMMLIFRFLIALSHISFSDITHNFMVSKSKFGFMSNFVVNIKKSLLYAVIHCFIIFPIDCLLLYGSFLLTTLIIKGIGVFGLPLSFGIVILIFALRFVLLSGWIPAIVYENKGVFESFAIGFKTVRKRFLSAYWTYASALVLSFAAVFLLTISTFGFGLIIGIPTAVTLFRCIELVIYFNCNGYHYYLDKASVVEGNVYD